MVDAPPKKTTLMLSALILALSALGSRVLGYFRDVIIAAKHGASEATDAYYAAFTLPDTLAYFLAGGALSIAFVPIYQRILNQEGRAQALRLFQNIATVGGAILVLGMMLAFVFTEPLVQALLPKFSPEQVQITADLSRILLPGPLFFFLGGLLGATEIAEKRFRSTALAPLVYNLCIILGGLLFSSTLGVSAFAWGALAGAILGPFGTNLYFARRHIRLRLHLDLKAPELRRYYIVALPLMLGVSLTTVDEWIGRYFASGLDAGSISWLNNARRLMLFPIALIGQAIGQAALPWLSQLASEGDDDGVFRELTHAMRSTGLLSASVATGLAALSLIAIAFVYGYGAYTDADVERTALILALLCAAIPAWSMQAVVARAFYARSHTWTPMLASSVAVALALPVYSAMTRSHGVYGIALATAVAMTLQLAILIGFHSLRYGRHLWLSALGSVLLGVLTSLPGAALAYLVVQRLWTLEASFLWTLSVAAIAGFTWLLIALPLLIMLGGNAAKPVRERIERIGRKILRRRVQ